MSTQRPNEENIIGSGMQNRTHRDDQNIISSNSGSNKIISSVLKNKIELNDKNFVIEKQIARSGEAEVFLVNQNNSLFVFKYYYSQFKPKDEVLKKLKGLKHPDIISLIDYGYYQGRFFEISEYATGGTLLDYIKEYSKFGLNEVKGIVHEINEALYYCHTNGIIHRDIKPENIFYRLREKKDLAIGDFGIASNLDNGEEFVRTTTARTSLYAGPELFTNIQGKTTIEKSIDYYALGMTILHLCFGRNPFEDMDEYAIMRIKMESRILFPIGIDQEVEKLIKGLITVNPRERWGYQDVCSWLKGESVQVHYQTLNLEYKPYTFGTIDGEQIVVNNPVELANYLERYPDKGVGHLYRNSIAKWVELVDSGLYNELMDVVEKEYPNDQLSGLTKAIYILDADRHFLGLNNMKLRNAEEISNHFEQHFNHFEKELKKDNSAFYIFLEARNYKEKADEYRSYFKKYNSELALNTLIFILQGADKFCIDNYSIHQPEELLRVDDATKNKIIQQLFNLNSKLSIWISGFNELQSNIDSWRIHKRNDFASLEYALSLGYNFNGIHVKDKAEFHQMLKSQFSSFFSNEDNSAIQNEANYWLENYCNSSLKEVLINFINSEEINDVQFVQLFSYILSENNQNG